MSTHPPQDLLLSYVTGGLPRPFSVLIASHLAFCRPCRAITERLDSIGGALFGSLEPQGEPDAGLAALLGRLDEPMSVPVTASNPDLDPETRSRLPAPLRDFIGRPFRTLPWRRVLSGVSIVDLATIAEHGARARLVLSRRGIELPRHVHDGNELTLVLSGGLSEQHGRFRRGDVLVVEPGEVHQPRTDSDEDCLCFAVTDGAVRFTGLIGRARQILAGY